MDNIEKAYRIYEASEDMDFGDYIEQKEEGIRSIASALDKLEEYAKKDNDLSVLWQAIDRIYG